MKDRKKGKGEKLKFELTFHDGYKGKERPKAIIIGAREFKIVGIIWRRRIQDKKTGATCEVFKCKMGKDTVKITIHDSGKWEIIFLCIIQVKYDI